MEPGDVGLLRGDPAELADVPLHLLLGLGDDLLDPRRGGSGRPENQLLQGELGGLAADVVEGRRR